MKPIGAITLAVAVAVVLATGPAAAQDSGPSGDSISRMMNQPEMMRDMPMNAPSEALGRERPLLSLALQNSSELGLSAEQVKTLQELVERFRKEADQRLHAIETAEREIAGLLNQQTTDLVQVDSKVRAIETLRADLRLRRIQTLAEGRAALTVEQRTKLDRLAAERGHSMQGQQTRGAEEMHRFMNSERMPQAMSEMMAMAKRMGDGDMMLGMVRMMEMMSMMGGGMTGEPERPAAPGQAPK